MSSTRGEHSRCKNRRGFTCCALCYLFQCQHTARLVSVLPWLLLHLLHCALLERLKLASNPHVLFWQGSLCHNMVARYEDDARLHIAHQNRPQTACPNHQHPTLLCFSWQCQSTLQTHVQTHVHRLLPTTTLLLQHACGACMLLA
jgi:hypothetical protein